MRWRLVKHIAHLRHDHRRATEEARRHLEQSRADRPTVEALSADLRREAELNGFTRRVRENLRGRHL